MAISTKFLRLAAMLFATLTTVLAASSTLWLSGDTGDYIFGGYTQTLSSPSSIFTAVTNSDGGVDITLNGGVVPTPTGPSSQLNASWAMSFAPPRGQTLSVGHYNNTTRYPFQLPAVPGLDVSGNGRGCDTSNGSFVLLDYQVSGSGVVQSFAADFIQHCEGATPKLTGSIRFNSSVPITLAGPTVVIGSVQPVSGGAIVKLDGSQSFPQGNAQLASYSWTQTSGTGVSLSNANSAVASFNAPQGSSNQVLSFMLTVTDSNGTTATSTVNITVNGTGGAGNLFSFTSDPGDTIGGGHSLAVTPGASQISITGNANHVHLGMSGSQLWSLDFAAPSGTSLVPGTTYANATRYPQQSAKLPGMDVSGNGTSCNQSNDSFTVNELDIDSTGTITGFSADFTQHCNGSLSALHGTIMYNTMPYSLSATLSGSGSSRTLTANVRVASADVGAQGQVYIAAVVGGKLIFNNGSGWVPVVGSHFPAYWSGQLSNFSFPLIANPDPLGLTGVTVYLGYGRTLAEMLSANRYRAVYSF